MGMKVTDEPHVVAVAEQDVIDLGLNYGTEVDWSFDELGEIADDFSDKKNFSSSDTFREANSRLTEFGFVVLDLSGAFQGGLPDPTIVTRCIALFGTPIRIFAPPHPFWRVVDVDENRPANRSRGVGTLPLHLDFVNADNPPDVICLFCSRSDAKGMGRSTVANFVGIENELSEGDRKLLEERVFRDGFVKNLYNIGGDMNPFSVLSHDGAWRVRYTANLLDMKLSNEHRGALERFHAVIEARAVAFDLRQHQLLLVDQHKALHGREALGEGQAGVPYAERRLLYHSFLRY